MQYFLVLKVAIMHLLCVEVTGSEIVKNIHSKSILFKVTYVAKNSVPISPLHSSLTNFKIMLIISRKQGEVDEKRAKNNPERLNKCETNET